MRTKVTLILVFLNVALFFFIFGIEGKWQTEDSARDARRRVLGPEAANIQALELSGPSLAAPIRLQRDGDTWRITSPYEWPANDFAVSRILHELQFLEHKTSFAVDELGATGLSLADYGLADPPLTVTFSDGAVDGTPVTTTSLAIGKETDIGNRLYVLSPDRKYVHVVDDKLAQALALDLDQLRAPACFTIPGYEVRSLNLQNAGPANVRVRLRREGNRWSFESPIVARADKDRTEIAISALNSLQTRNFLGAPSSQPALLATAGTITPSLRITLEGNNRRETLLLGAPVDPSQPDTVEADREYYAQMEGRNALFTIVLPGAPRPAISLANTLRNPQNELRDKLVLDLENRSIDAVTLTDAEGREVILQQLEPPAGVVASTANPWQVVQRTADGSLRTQPADQDVVEHQLLRDLSLLRAERFDLDAPSDAELESRGLSRPERTIALNFKPEPGTALSQSAATLLIGTDQTRSQTYAKMRLKSFVYTVDAAILAATPVDPLHYRRRLLRELPEGARLTGITLRDLTTNHVLYEHELAAGETWEKVFAAAPAPQRKVLPALRTELRTLRAQSFVSDHFTERVEVSGDERGWRFRLDAKLSLTGDASNQLVDSTLFLADRDGGDRQLVGSPEFDVVFEARQPLIDAIWTLSYAARDPGPVQLTPPPATLGADPNDDEPSAATPSLPPAPATDMPPPTS